MLALVYRLSIPRYLACQVASRLWRRRFFPGIAPLSLQEREFSKPDGWATVKVSRCGICGSDMSLLRGGESFLMEPYASLPFILGHEAVGEIVDAPEHCGFEKGQRVAVEPMLACEARGLEPCRFCEQGDYNLCENFTRGDLQPGMVMGFNASVGGGMAQYMAAHPSQMVAVPDSIDDDTAVLVDSVASALQPALHNRPPDDGVAVVYGAGVIGQQLVRCLRALGSRARIVVAARHGFQRDLAIAGGADDVLMSPDRNILGKAVDAQYLPTTMGGGNLEGGATHFFDCVGSRRSIQDGLLCLRAKGRYVMVATAGTVKGVDFCSLWHRELRMCGTNCYATGVHNGHSVRTYQLAMDLLASPGYPAHGLLTHVFSLDEWRKAFTTAFDKRGAASVKVAIAP